MIIVMVVKWAQIMPDIYCEPRGQQRALQAYGISKYMYFSVFLSISHISPYFVYFSGFHWDFLYFITHMHIAKNNVHDNSFKWGDF